MGKVYEKKNGEVRSIIALYVNHVLLARLERARKEQEKETGLEVTMSNFLVGHLNKTIKK